MGLANYYSGYVKSYASLAAPLMEMLKGQPTSAERSSSRVPLSKWGLEQERAFLELKEALLKSVPLNQLDLDKLMYLCTDASKYAIGDALQQKVCDCDTTPN